MRIRKRDQLLTAATRIPKHVHTNDKGTLLLLGKNYIWRRSCPRCSVVFDQQRPVDAPPAPWRVYHDDECRKAARRESLAASQRRRRAR